MANSSSILASTIFFLQTVAKKYLRDMKTNNFETPTSDGIADLYLYATEAGKWQCFIVAIDTKKRKTMLLAAVWQQKMHLFLPPCYHQDQSFIFIFIKLRAISNSLFHNLSGCHFLKFCTGLWGVFFTWWYKLPEQRQICFPFIQNDTASFTSTFLLQN